MDLALTQKIYLNFLKDLGEQPINSLKVRVKWLWSKKPHSSVISHNDKLEELTIGNALSTISFRLN